MDATRIVRDFSGPDLMFVALLDDVEIGRYPTAVEADDALWAALDATPEAQAWMKQMGERVRAGAPYALLLDCAGPDVPLDGPSVEEEGGEGGEPPPDDYVAALAAHVAREYTAFLAAAPDSPAPSFLPTAPAGDAAANVAGLEVCRVCGEMHAPPSEVCDVNGCGRGPVGVYWFGIPGRRYPARLCSAHGTVVMR